MPEDPLLDKRSADRIQVDKARNRQWELDLDHVRVYDTAKKKLIQQIALPIWAVTNVACKPDLALDKTGSAFISSNAIVKLWQRGADSLK